MRRELAPGERLGRKPMWRFPPHTLFRTRRSPHLLERALEDLVRLAPSSSSRRSRTKAGMALNTRLAALRRRCVDALGERGRTSAERLSSRSSPASATRRADCPCRRCSWPPPVRAHETRVHLLVQAALPRELRELERLPRVGNDLRRRVVLEAGLHDHLPRPLVDVLRIAAVEFLARDPSGGYSGCRSKGSHCTFARAPAPAMRPAPGPPSRTVRCSRSRSRRRAGSPFHATHLSPS
jgi:hypothetical protein